MHLASTKRSFARILGRSPPQVNQIDFQVDRVLTGTEPSVDTNGNRVERVLGTGRTRQLLTYDWGMLAIAILGPLPFRP
jgi:hypothetical protein